MLCEERGIAWRLRSRRIGSGMAHLESNVNSVCVYSTLQVPIQYCGLALGLNKECKRPVINRDMLGKRSRAEGLTQSG